MRTQTTHIRLSQHARPAVALQTLRCGFTLIEMVMVLVILAILATAALNVVDVQVDQTRFELTQQTVDVIDRAVLGPEYARAADGSRAVSGFVADCGRLPLTLEELYIRPALLVPALTSGSPAGDDEVTVTGGWNGPYLKLAVGGSSLPDGWADPFETFQSDGTASLATDPIGIVRSLGRDLAVGGTDYDKDISLIFQADAAAVALGLAGAEENRWQEPLRVDVFYNDATTNPDHMNGQKIVVRVYGPVADAAGNVSLGTVAQEVLAPDYTSDGPVSISFTDLSAGPRIIRAYQLSTATDPAATDELSTDTDLEKVSVATRLVVSNETSSIPLILRD